MNPHQRAGEHKSPPKVGVHQFGSRIDFRAHLGVFLRVPFLELVTKETIKEQRSIVSKSPSKTSPFLQIGVPPFPIFGAGVPFGFARKHLATNPKKGTKRLTIKGQRCGCRQLRREGETVAPSKV